MLFGTGLQSSVGLPTVLVRSACATAWQGFTGLEAHTSLLESALRKTTPSQRGVLDLVVIFYGSFLIGEGESPCASRKGLLSHCHWTLPVQLGQNLCRVLSSRMLPRLSKHLYNHLYRYTVQSSHNPLVFPRPEVLGDVS